ncbi:zinc ribbon domain-containing protein [Roseiflexus sp.]|uniref:zinc ribbon domain-containing protein n=1 Tax=Roseiflexus sp. TaxID=2562120 RepID=UPI00398AF360
MFLLRQRTYKRHRYCTQQGKWRGEPIPYGLQPDSTGWFEYRRYRCAGRLNKPGSCHTPMLSADALERLVLDIVTKNVIERSREALLKEINDAIASKRGELLSAIEVAEEWLREPEERREMVAQ